MTPVFNQGSTRGGRVRLVLLAALVAFVLGAAAALAAAWRFDWLPGLFHTGATGPAVAGSRSTAPLPVAATLPAVIPPTNASGADAGLGRVVERQGGLEQRLAAAEQRLARLDLQAQAATGNAARAEGLLIAFAARRAIDRGEPLGYLADQLRLRFGDAMPIAVDTVVAGAQRPVTLDQLVTRLNGLGPELSSAPSDLSLASLGDELASLFVIRRDTTPGLQPAQRLERAKLFLTSGRVPAAIAEVRNLPGAANAGSWIGDAQRYAAVQRALDLLETSAVLEPRRLRDRNGVVVEQLSPVASPGPAQEVR